MPRESGKVPDKAWLRQGTSNKDFIKPITLLSPRISSQFLLFPSLWQYLLKMNLSCLGSLSHPVLYNYTGHTQTPNYATSTPYNLNDPDFMCRIGGTTFPFPHLYLAHRSWSWLDSKINTDPNTSLNHLLNWLTAKNCNLLGWPAGSWLNREREWKQLSIISIYSASVEY